MTDFDDDSFADGDAPNDVPASRSDAEIIEAGERRIDGHLEELGIDAEDRGDVRSRAEELLPDLVARYGDGYETGIKALEAAVEDLGVTPVSTDYDAIVRRHTARTERRSKAT